MSYARNPIDLIAQEHALQLTLCNMLEQIADSLLDDINPALLTSAVSALKRELPMHRQDDEEGLFPLLQRRSREGDSIASMLQCLTEEHANDASFADEILEYMELMADGRAPDNPNMVGYMLRGFFTCYRRHLAWEDTIVLPLARDLLTEEDLCELFAVFMDNRRHVSLGVFPSAE